MNKSKFLKKSLAIVLSVMMVVAMIPLSASATAENYQFVNTNGITSITTGATDKLTTVVKGTEYTNTKVYNDEDATEVAVTLSNGYDVLFAKVTDKDGEAEDEFTEITATDSVATVEVEAGAKKVEFFAADEDYDYEENDGTRGTVCTINFEQPKASTSYALKSAIIGESTTDTGAITGTIDNAKKTISFVVPWGYKVNSDKVIATLENPVAGTATIECDVPDRDGETAETLSVTNQAGNTTSYKVYATEEDCLAGVSVAGVAGVRDTEKNDDGETVYLDSYTVTLPLGTTIATAGEVVKYTMASGVTKVTGATVKVGSGSAAAAFNNGSKVVFADGDTLTVELTSKADTTKSYDITVNVAQSNEAEITAFTATASVGSDPDAQAYTENGTIDGDKLNVVLPKAAVVTSVDVEFTTSTGATVSVAGYTEDEGVWTVDLTNPVIVTVTAADGETKKVYELSATKATATQGNPTISALKMVLNKGESDEAEYNADIKGNVITFSGLPYATTYDDIATADWAMAKTRATYVDEDSVNYKLPEGETDFFAATWYITVRSDNDEANTYSIVFKKNAAKTGKDLSSFEFTYASTSDKVTTDNTCKAKIDTKKKTITVTLPYSFDGADAKNLVAVFAASEGAKVYTVVDGDVTDAVESGFYAEDYSVTESQKQPKNTFAHDELNDSQIVIANEVAAYNIDTAEDDVTVTALTEKPYKNNAVVYTFVVKYADPETGATLKKLTADEGKVTSKITDTTIEITVPASYVGKAFFADVEASKLASVKAGSTNIVVDDKTVEQPATGALKVVSEENSGVTETDLQVYNGSDWVEVSTITVTSEDNENVNNHEVSVKIADAKTGADLISVTVAGVKATIDTAARTAKVVLPFGTDLTDVIVAYEASELATVTTSLTPVVDDDEAEHYDLTDGMTFTVAAEDNKTVKVYTLTVTTASQFSDVDATAYYADDVYTAASKGIIKGYANGTFKPNNNITRRDFAIMVTRMLNADTSSYTTAAFPDVKSGDYGLAAIAYCSDKGIITGRPNGKFAPDEYISRQDAAIILARALELTSTATSTEFKDNAKIRTDAVASVAAASAAGIIVGDANGNFRPTDNIKRCDAAVMMVRALNK